MSGWAIVSMGISGGEKGYMLYPNVAPGIKVDPVYEQGKTWGQPGVGFWGIEPDTLKAVNVSFRAEPHEDGHIYTVVLARGLAEVLEANPELRRELLNRLREGSQGLA